MKKEAKTKRMTMDKLAGLVKTGFNRVDKKFDHIEDLVDKLAVSALKGFERLEKKMATKDDIKDMATKVDIEGLKTKVEGIDKRIDDFAETKASKITYKELANRVDFIEDRLEIKR